MGDSSYEEAIYWLQRAYDLFARLGAGNAAARTIGNLGWCYYSLGDPEKAQAAFEEATARFAKVGDQRNQQTWLGNSGTVFLDAVGFFRQQSTDTNEHSRLQENAKTGAGSAMWLTDLATANIQRGELDTADRYNAESIAIKGELNDKVKRNFTIG